MYLATTLDFNIIMYNSVHTSAPYILHRAGQYQKIGKDMNMIYKFH